MKKLIALVLAVLMIAALAGCTAKPAPAEKPSENPTAQTAEPSAEKVEFTDSVGRKVEVPANITKVAITGTTTQIMVFALCPDKLVGVANKWDEISEQYIKTEYYNLPELGHLYGGKGDLNLESLLASGAQVVIDMGEPKKTIKEDLDALQEQAKLPFVHITATLSGMGEAYRKLGELVGMKEEAEVLAKYCENVYEQTNKIVESTEKANLLYVTGPEGHNVIAKGSFQAEVINLLSNNLADVADPSSRGSGNEVDLEQILNWNPDVVLFTADSIYKTVAEDEVWKNVTAIKNGTYYEVPEGPYNWMGSPTSGQRYLGMLWMTKLLYPEQATYDLYEATAEYFKLFFHSDLTKEQYDALVENSIGAQAKLKPAA